MSELIPDRYRIELPADPRVARKLVNIKSGEWFFLTNRSFPEVDFHFNHLLSRAISTLGEISPASRKLQVLDVGGGIESRCANGIAARFKNKVSVVSIDLTAQEAKSQAQPMVGSILKLPIADATIDVAYSRATGELLAEADWTSLQTLIQETARVLRPGAVALMDDGGYITRGAPWRKDVHFEPIPTIEFYAKKMGFNLSPLERFLELFEHRYDSSLFLLLVKQPVHPRLRRALKLNNPLSLSSSKWQK